MSDATQAPGTCSSCGGSCGCGPKNWNLKQLGFGGFIKQLYAHHKQSGGILILRLVIGILFVAAGWWKVMHMQMTIGFFSQMGFTVFEAYLVGWLELVGGVFLILGILTKPVCFAFAVQMAVIVWGTPSTQAVIYFGHDYNFVLLGTFVAMYIMGPGKYSMAHLWLKRKGRPAKVSA